jgi:hypothetical protein
VFENKVVGGTNFIPCLDKLDELLVEQIDSNPDDVFMTLFVSDGEVSDNPTIEKK